MAAREEALLKNINRRQKNALATASLPSVRDTRARQISSEVQDLLNRICAIGEAPECSEIFPQSRYLASFFDLNYNIPVLRRLQIEVSSQFHPHNWT